MEREPEASVSDGAPESAIDGPVAVRAGDEASADDWSLVLEAAGIEHARDEADGLYRVLVAPEQLEAARRALDGWDAEQAAGHGPLEPAPDYGRTQVGAVAGVLLLGFFLVARFVHSIDWLDRGSAVAERILHGEPWRAVTALTLHANAAHVAGNAIALVFLLGAVARWIGPGAASWLTLAAGALGNFATALVHGVDHISIGASTATFGAMGLLAGLQLTGRRGGTRRAIAVVGAALALLGMLGVGERADVFAHLFGLLIGGLLGAVAGRRVARAPRRTLGQPLAAVGALAAVALCWLAALR